MKVIRAQAMQRTHKCLCRHYLQPPEPNPTNGKLAASNKKRGANPPLSAINPDERYPDPAKRYNNPNTPNTTHPPKLS